MTTLPSANKARTSRGRRGSRPSGDDRELAILATAERLLEERPLGEISIDDLAKGAGISRPTFYFYFRSKDAVLLSLLDRVAAEADTVATSFANRRSGDPATLWREVIGAFFHTFHAHRSVAIACAQAKATSPEVRELWATVMGKWVRRTQEAIQAERDRGVAPDDGVPAADLAVALNLMNERAMYSAYANERPSIAEDDVVDVLLQVWLSTIYRTTTPSSTPAR
ncbi:MAG TPA: TetR/AcrR family transcriptional regulator [Pseudonocardia sp.]